MRFLFVLFIILFDLFNAGTLAAGPIPEKRVILSRDSDFPGGDIGQVFDTSLEACEAGCLGNAACRAFTFNSRNGACFLKDDPGAPAEYAGALSGEVIEVPRAVLERAGERAARLDFLDPEDLEAAGRRAGALAHEFFSGGWAAEELARLSREAEREANIVGAMRYRAAVVVLTDAPEDWSEYARLADAAGLAVSEKREARELFEAGLEGAVAAYLRAASPQTGARALSQMAVALENLGRGRTALSA
ncbi:MAG: alpha-2-macroglobulin family protein, partial [Alphaproteobacteria bacterium]